MHLADGILSTPVIAVTYVGAIASIALASKKTEEADIPKISLMAGTFFAVSLITIPVPPTSVHPLISGLIGIVLGPQAPLALSVALLLQALLFKHGGITTLGANILMFSIPAYLSYLMYKKLPIRKPTIRAGVIGALSVVMTAIILVTLLAITDQRFAQGNFSVAKIVLLSHIPIMIVEAVITAFAIGFIEKNQPNWIN